MTLSNDKSIEKNQTLITSLGVNAGSFTSLLDALIKENININKIYCVSTIGQDEKIRNIVFPAIQKEIENCPIYRGKNIQLMEPLWIEIEDFKNSRDLMDFQNSLTEVFNTCVNDNDKITISVTSGRKIIGNVIDRLSMLYGAYYTYFAGVTKEYEERIQKDCQSEKISLEKCIKNICKNSCFPDGVDCRNGIADFFVQYDESSIDIKNLKFDYRLHVNPKYLYLIKVPVVDMMHIMHFNQALDEYEHNPKNIFLKGITDEEKPYFLERGFFDSNGNVSEGGKFYTNILTPGSKIKEMLNKQYEILSKRNPVKDAINIVGLFIGISYSFIQIILIKKPTYVNILFVVSIITFISFILLPFIYLLILYIKERHAK